MSKYMLLLYAEERGGIEMPAAEMAKWMEKMHAYAAALEKAGAHVSHGALGITADATTVHVEDGQMQVHNGPFAETKEQLGGYYMIDVPTLAEAQQWAAKCPAALWGKVEIRRVQDA